MKRYASEFLLVVVLAMSFLSASDVRAEDFDSIIGLLELVIDADADSARKCLTILTDKIQSREIAGDSLAALRPRLINTLGNVFKERERHALYPEAVIALATLKDPAGAAPARELLKDGKKPMEQRRGALEALLFAGDVDALRSVPALLQDKATSPEFRAMVLSSLGRSEEMQVATMVLASYSELEPDLQPKAIELLTQRPTWSRALLDAMGQQKISPNALNANQVTKLLASRDEELVKMVRAKWGSVRAERNPQRESVIAQVRELLAQQPGDAFQGHQVFKRVCGQCHKIYGEGQEVGPDVTANGRASFEQLLSNVLDPSLVIGASYQARTVITSDGRVLTGLLAEDNEQRVVLKMQGGKVETIARDDIEEMKISKLSLMPEGLETQLKPQELLDLFQFLSLDKPPTDKKARYIPGTKLAEPK